MEMKIFKVVSIKEFLILKFPFWILFGSCELVLEI